MIRILTMREMIFDMIMRDARERLVDGSYKQEWLDRDHTPDKKWHGPREDEFDREFLTVLRTLQMKIAKDDCGIVDCPCQSHWGHPDNKKKERPKITSTGNPCREISLTMGKPVPNDLPPITTGKNSSGQEKK